MKLPDNIFGINTREAYKKYMEESAKKPEEKPIIQPAASTAGINPGDYLFMPAHNLYIAKQKLHFGNDWYQSHEQLHKEDARMLTLREFIDFLIMLRLGNAQDGLGNLVSGQEVQSIYDEITTVRDPWRSEWIDAYFTKQPNADTFNINYSHRTINGQLQPQKTEPLEQRLLKNCKVDIQGFNRQGMPTKKGNDFNYWHPQDNRVAGFGADSGRAGFGCFVVPLFSVASLGVRAARAKI